MQLTNELLLSKSLFARGRDGLRGAGLFDAGLAVSMFHDAVELLLAATGQKVGAIVSKNQKGAFFSTDAFQATTAEPSTYRFVSRILARPGPQKESMYVAPPFFGPRNRALGAACRF